MGFKMNALRFIRIVLTLSRSVQAESISDLYPESTTPPKNAACPMEGVDWLSTLSWGMLFDHATLAHKGKTLIATSVDHDGLNHGICNLLLGYPLDNESGSCSTAAILLVNDKVGGGQGA
jgi:hypothetical protein